LSEVLQTRKRQNTASRLPDSDNEALHAGNNNKQQQNVRYKHVSSNQGVDINFLRHSTIILIPPCQQGQIGRQRQKYLLTCTALRLNRYSSPPPAPPKPVEHQHARYKHASCNQRVDINYFRHYTIILIPPCQQGLIGRQRTSRHLFSMRHTSYEQVGQVDHNTVRQNTYRACTTKIFAHLYGVTPEQILYSITQHEDKLTKHSAKSNIHHRTQNHIK
jgi:hypothetical protein